MSITISETVRIWERALKKIESKINDRAIFTSLFEGSYIDQVKGDTFVIVFSKAFAAQLMRTRYADLIQECISEVTEDNFKIECVDVDSVKKKDNRVERTQKSSIYFQDARIDSSLTFDNFVVGAFNKEAGKAAQLIANYPGKKFNPLFMHSNSGLGKTHLLNAIGNYVLKNRNPNAKILYITAADFVNEFVKYVKDTSSSEALRDYFKDVDLLLFDDVQFLSGKVKTEEFFFHIYNDLINRGSQVVITSDVQPVELKGLEDRLITRFMQGLVVKIDEPDVLTCEQIFRKKVTESGLDIDRFDDDVIEFFAKKFSKNVRELESALNRIIFTIETEDDVDRITLDVANKAVLTLDGGKTFSNQISERKIINIVADYYNLEPSQIIGKTRTEQIVLARHISMYLVRDLLDIPLKKIGEAFGGRDHTTVMSAIEKVDKELKTDALLRNAIEELKRRINN